MKSAAARPASRAARPRASCAQANRLPPRVARQRRPLRPLRLGVEIQAGADRTRPLGNVEEAPDLTAGRQTGAATFVTHVVGLPDQMDGTQLGERPQRLRGELARLVARP